MRKSNRRRTYGDVEVPTPRIPDGLNTTGPYQVAPNVSFTATIDDPGGLTASMGARVETPVNRAIVSFWRAATLATDTHTGESMWSVTLDSPVSTGPYNLVWMTSDAEPAEFEAFVPLIVVDADTLDETSVDFPEIDVSQVTPTVDEIAALERSRTMDANGNDQGTFTSSTVPVKASDVTTLIGEAISDVLGRIPDAIDPNVYDRVKRAIALQTAILIETSFFRVQGISPSGRGVGGQSSNVFTYRTMLEDLITELNSVAASPDEGMRLV